MPFHKGDLVKLNCDVYFGPDLYNDDAENVIGIVVNVKNQTDNKAPPFILVKWLMGQDANGMAYSYVPEELIPFADKANDIQHR